MSIRAPERGPCTRQVADFVTSVGWLDLPASVQEHSLCCVLDLCGAALAGTRTRVAQIAATYALAMHGQGAASVVGRERLTTPVGAALANGFAASALDIDDGYRPVKGHPGSVVFPAALAAAEGVGATGAAFLTALVVGYEVAIRAGLILHPLYGFYHGTGAWAPLGAAAAAARLLGSSREQTWHALGVAEFHGAMTPEMRSVDDPSMLKDGIGWGAMVGLAGAELAVRGFTGIPSLFDTGSPGEAAEAAARLTASLGREYLFSQLYFKPYACCRWAQPAVQAALQAVRELGTHPRDVSRVRVHTFEAATHLRCAAPATTEEAQFSVPWPVACALIDGTVGPAQMAEERLADPALRRLAARVELVTDPKLENAFPAEALAWAEVEVVDGRIARSGTLAAPGDPRAPLTQPQLNQKFAELATSVLGRVRATEMVEVIQALPNAPNLDHLTRLLRSADARPIDRGAILTNAGGSA